MTARRVCWYIERICACVLPGIEPMSLIPQHRTYEPLHSAGPAAGRPALGDEPGAVDGSVAPVGVLDVHGASEQRIRAAGLVERAERVGEVAVPEGVPKVR